MTSQQVGENRRRTETAAMIPDELDVDGSVRGRDQEGQRDRVGSMRSCSLHD